MNKIILSICTVLLLSFSAIAQSTVVKGKVLDTYSNEPIPDVEVDIQGSNFHAQTDAEGTFEIFGDAIPEGEQTLILVKAGYVTLRIPVMIASNQTNQLVDILMAVDLAEAEAQIGIISLSEEQLDEDEGTASNVSGLLQASRDVFLSAASFDFSSTFFRPRGYDSESGKVLINGLEMNKLYDGRPQWSNWGGLNDVQRNQLFTMGMSASEYTFGDLAGSTNIIMRASQYRKGGRISYASGNRSYRGRVMGSYNSGLLANGWAYSVLLARRYANEGYNEGTLYDANSFFASVEKKINDNHSLNFTAFYTPNRRGKSSANTQEVYDLKGSKYNSYWGYQEGEMRNSRIKEVEEPVFMLNHYWTISPRTELNTNVGYQIGHTGNTRLGYDNAPNPDPAYYQNLPSFFLANSDGPNYEGAYRAYEKFINDGQIDWYNLYETNILYGGTSRYYLYEDRNDDKQLSANTILNSQLTDNIQLTAAVNYRNLNSHNYAKMLDLLGGNGYLDVDTFNQGDESQSDLNNPNKVIGKGDAFKYSYEMNASQVDAFAQGQFSYSTVDFYVAGKYGQTSYQRNGLYRNGSYPDENDSFGKSEKLNFSTYGAKGGFTYKINGKNAITANGSYFTTPPTMRNSFSNSRQNNRTVIGLTEETNVNVDASYIYRTPFIKARLTGYYSLLQDGSEISFFYADGISIQGRTATTAFIQEVLTDIDKRNVGMELGIEAQVTPTIKLKGAAAYGQSTYANNPELYITSDDFVDPQFFGKSFLKDYHVAGGPEQAYQLGFEYRDPAFWWFGVTANYFSHGYINISPLARTKNFYTDTDGMPFADYDAEKARQLLKQERFDDYMLVNVVGGKSWRLNRQYFLGFFASINNAFDKQFKTGGFEQGRNANYKTLSKDTANDTRVFGPKYWYGYGANYYINVYLRF
ncbi:MAG TPA: TonB-dependent receptor [Flavobacteriaceae bacterium]|nr:TonB-dependent receptor [Flavobacteriaceae bacterium]